MLSLKDKLKQFDTTDKVRDDEKKSCVIPSDFVPVENKDGKFILRQKQFSLDFQHGHESIKRIFDVDIKKIAYLLKDSNFKDFDVQKAIFIDTETTGLAGGTGTMAFLVGIGRFFENEFVIKQYILQNPAQEKAQLNQILNDSQDGQTIVSYNGKSFDIPLLQTRCILNRLKSPFHHMYHMDLLHMNRRFYSPFVDSCSLQNMENYLLGFQRHDDIPGSEIPHLYFRFLRHQDLNSLTPVCKHNAIDILSMIAFIIENEKIFKENCQILQKYSKEKKLECLIQSAAIDKALEFAIIESESNAAFLHRKARLFKQQGFYKKALDVWQQLCAKSQFDERSFIEIAKLYEHQFYEYKMAIEIIAKLEKKAYIHQELTGKRLQYDDDLEKRKNRLLRKIENLKIV